MTGRRWIAGVVLGAALALQAERSQVCGLTDISNEPDDEESLVRFLVCANEYEVEGLIATTSAWLRERTREDLIRRQLEAYKQVQPNPLKPAAGFPSADARPVRLPTGSHDGG